MLRLMTRRLPLADKTLVRTPISYYHKKMNAEADDSSSSSNVHMNHDVFLSFRGPDTRKIFTGHLYAALQRKAIFTFIDSEKLEKGTAISVLLEAIEMSKLSIVIFSKDYAFSTWCLKELAKIMECMDSKKKQKVVPIFYAVEPREIIHQTGRFKEAFDKYEREKKVNPEDLQRWRSALTKAGGISGWTSDEFKDDLKLVEDIATNILRKLKPDSKHDVFLSVHSEEYKSFVSHLEAGLKQVGISTFLATDKQSNAVRHKAVDESGIFVVVFSGNYPWGSRCLKDLVKIMERMEEKKKQIVIIFYDGVTPSKFLADKKDFDKIFAHHKKERFTTEELNEWNSALIKASRLPGLLTTTYENDATLIEDICEQISKNLIETGSKTNQLALRIPIA